MKEISSVKSWTNAFATVDTAVEDLLVLNDFFKEGESTDEEITQQYDKTLTAIEKLELRNMLTVSEAIARSALERTESRGAHSRLDHVGSREGWDHVNVATARDGEAMTVRRTPTLELPEELRSLVASGQA
jgi:succinate dehydrogenase/fumarate reductase flavoprotein subunit